MRVSNKIFTPYSDGVDSREHAERLPIEMDFLARTFPLFLFLKFLGLTNCEYFIYLSSHGLLVYLQRYSTFLFATIDLLSIIIKEKRLTDRVFSDDNPVVYDEKIL